MTAEAVGSLTPMWQTTQAPGLGLSQPWLLQAFEGERAEPGR